MIDFAHALPMYDESGGDDSALQREIKPSLAPKSEARSGDRDLFIGLDVGSTTVKAVVVDPRTDEILWQDYERHETKQPEKVLEFLCRIEADLSKPPESFRLFVAGSGGAAFAHYVGAKFVQEVTAVSLAVEKLYPETDSVVELGGQDAKIIVFKDLLGSDKKKKIPSMNDKCAGGTGAVIDKINAKLKIAPDDLRNQGYDGIRLHHVAGKCGVFAETDINGLQKQGVPTNELMASLFESIIQQNLSVLTRGHTLRPVVLLLGGPNTYITGMVECWRHNIPLIWEERGVEVPDRPIDELIVVPDNAQYFAAIGAVEFGKQEEPGVGFYLGTEALSHYLNVGRVEEKRSRGSGGLSESNDELEAFKTRFKKEEWEPAAFETGQIVSGFVGVDSGSTSTKAVLMGLDRRLLAKAYQLSKGNPIEDTVQMFGNLREQIESQGATLDVLGVATTGYAKDVLKGALAADVALVETVAHTKAAVHYYPQVDVICDVGGQDIKIIILKNGQVKDFKLNTQCSAGNGYFLQSTADQFGYAVEEFAEVAFDAESMPDFGYGCAVFMQSDIVDFQRQGWKPQEIMAGLANVIPKNIWLYVSQISNLSNLGKTFVLQGGTQHNLAAVKSQVDFIESRFDGKSVKPEVIVHKFTGESGAIGAALEAALLYDNGHLTEFIGLDAVEAIEYTTTRDERTRCYFCKNKCLRTFVDVRTSQADETKEMFSIKSGPEQPRSGKARRNTEVSNTGAVPAEIAPDADQTPRKQRKMDSKIPIALNTTRIIIATCEKGTVEDVGDMRGIKAELDTIKKANPNLIEIAANTAFKSFKPPIVVDRPRRLEFLPSAKARARGERSDLRIGIPRVLNMYSLAPFFTAYFESLGIKDKNLVWSDYTSEEMYKEGAKRGAIDPCFPSKVCIPHMHNLLQVHHAKKVMDFVFFPMIDVLPSQLVDVQAHRACPTVTATSESVKAAFTKEGDLFAELGIRYINPLLNPGEPKKLEREMFETWQEILGLSVEENARAVCEGFAALDTFVDVVQRDRARSVLDDLEDQDRLGMVLLARPYHNDPGINHEIMTEFQKLGYPIFSQASLPLDKDILQRLFGDEVAEGDISDPLDIGDVWKNSYSENTSQKIFAAKYVARHPNLVALEMSNFKCGHDAPVYTVVEEIIEASGTPLFSFKDIDENKPTGSIKIRVETISYFLAAYRETLVRHREQKQQIDTKMRELEVSLKKKMSDASIGDRLIGA